MNYLRGWWVERTFGMSLSKHLVAAGPRGGAWLPLPGGELGGSEARRLALGWEKGVGEAEE